MAGGRITGKRHWVPVTNPAPRPCGLPFPRLPSTPVPALLVPTFQQVPTALQPVLLPGVCVLLIPRPCRLTAGLPPSTPVSCHQPAAAPMFPTLPSAPSSPLPPLPSPSSSCPPSSFCLLFLCLSPPFLSFPLFSLALGRASGYPANNHSRSLWAPAPAVSMDEGPTQTWMLQLPCQPRTPHSTGLVGR